MQSPTALSRTIKIRRGHLLEPDVRNSAAFPNESRILTVRFAFRPSVFLLVAAGCTFAISLISPAQSCRVARELAPAAPAADDSPPPPLACFPGFEFQFSAARPAERLLARYRPPVDPS